MSFVLVAQAAEYLHRVFNGGFVHLHGGKAALQRGVFFYILSVFFQRGGTYSLQFAAGEHGL